MINYIVLIIISLLACSCDDKTFPCPSDTEKDREIITLTFDDFKSQPENYFGKFVKITGMCVRLGRHGGTDMYIIGQDPAFEIKVTAGENVVKFSRYFEGRTIEIYGCVRGDDTIYAKGKDYNSGAVYKKKYNYSKLEYYIECNKYK